MTDLDKIIISIAIEAARANGLKEEEEIAAAANRIAQDATLESPNTPEGMEVRTRALKALEDKKNGIESPYFPAKEFDMREYYANTVNISVKPVFEAIAKYSENLGRQLGEPTKESNQIKLDLLEKMSIEVFAILNQNKVPLQWYSEFIADLKTVIADLDGTMKDQVQGHTKEIVSRTIGIRHPNPKVNTFNESFATYADLLAARQKVKEATGNNDADYFPPKGDELE